MANCSKSLDVDVTSRGRQFTLTQGWSDAFVHVADDAEAQRALGDRDLIDERARARIGRRGAARRTEAAVAVPTLFCLITPDFPEAYRWAAPSASSAPSWAEVTPVSPVMSSRS